MKAIHLIAIFVILGLLVTTYYISSTNPDLRFLFFATFMLSLSAAIVYFWSRFTGLDRMVMGKKQRKERSWEFWQKYKAQMGEPAFEILPGENILIRLAPAYFSSYNLIGAYKGIVVTNMRILIGFSLWPGRGEEFATSESFGKRNNLWHRDAPEIPQSIGKADIRYSFPFAGPLRTISNYDSRITRIESGNDELGDFVSVSFTGGGITFYTPDAKRIVEIFSNPIVK